MWGRAWEMWGRALGGSSQLLLLLLLPGSMGLECLSCGAEDGTCRGGTNVTCPPDSSVCAEALAALTWSHGRLALGGRGCARGVGGASSRALPLGGLALYVQRRQCQEGKGCNGKLPLGTEEALPLPGNASAQPPNGLRCYGCPEEGPCPPGTIVDCYGDLQGCFHGNLSLSLGGATLWREVRGCTRDPSCQGERRGDEVVTLIGSCCAGDLCNRQLIGQAFFDPDWPRLQLLPHGHAPAPAPSTPGSNATPKMAAGAVSTPPGVEATPKMAAGTLPKPPSVEATPKMAAGALTKPPGVETTPKMAAGALPKSPDVETTPKMAAGALPTPPGVEATPKMAAEEVVEEVGGGSVVKEGADDVTHVGVAGGRMASGRSAAGRPLEAKPGTKGPVGRAQRWVGPAWFLPFLLVLLL